MPAASSSLTAAAPVTTPSPVDPAAVVPPGLLDALARVPDPRARRGRRFQLTTLLAVGVCAMTCAGHNSLVSIAEWARRCEQEVLARLGCSYDPFAGRYRAPGERTLRDAFARVDPAALTAAGFAHLTALATAPLAPVNPDGTREREQRRAHRTARRVRPGHQTIRRRAIAVDGKCLRGAVRADGSKVFVLSAVRHDDALTAALREIGAKTNEIIHRKRRRLGTKKWSTETVYAVTDLAAHQADAAEIAAWARGHWMIESTVHWSKDVVFGEDLSQARRHRTPVVVSVFRDLARAALHPAGWANIASGRRAHTRPEAILTLHGIP
ncbi:DDE family transposase [Streptomyces brevispora]|uniref:DDE family transposase n=1 Tax=Streptomyces brevispora TaxID=887462 RepID=A0A561UTZ0_9ACTN|nr:transposase family protein [Streptomyces brevispora]TWG02830.1 DDE family transposase [Streptomyces brevispora]